LAGRMTMMPRASHTCNRTDQLYEIK
jgi:hypothetical protein